MATNNIINEQLFKEMQSLNPELEKIVYDGLTNTISYDEHKINLGNFSLFEIYNQYSQLKSDIEVMNPVDLFNIISVNVAVNEKENTNNENIEQIKKIEPTIKNIKIIKKKDEAGIEKQFVHITTTDDASHILYDYSPNDVLTAFKSIAQKNGNSYQGITENDLHTELQSKMNNIENKIIQGISNLSKIEKPFMISPVLKDEWGNPNSNKSTDNQEHAISDDNKSIDDQEIIIPDPNKLIDDQEYISIINNPNELNNEDIKKKQYFESFMSKLYTYKSYLGKDALDMWNNYEQYIIINSTLDNCPPKVSEAINVYNTINDESKQIELKNAENKNLVLNYQAELARKNEAAANRAGVASALLIVEITSIVSVVLATAVFVLLRT